DLTIADVVRVARGGARVELAEDALERARRARAVVEAALARGESVYGLTTGVGVHKQAAPERGDEAAFNRRLVASHRVAQGPPYAEEVVRAALVRLANGFARGTAGVRPELLARVVDALDAGASPPVRMLG